MDVSGCGLGVKPELGLVSGSSSSSSSGGSLNETSSSSFPSSSLEIKLKSSLVSVEEMDASVNQSINQSIFKFIKQPIGSSIRSRRNSQIIPYVAWLSGQDLARLCRRMARDHIPLHSPAHLNIFCELLSFFLLS